MVTVHASVYKATIGYPCLAFSQQRDEAKRNRAAFLNRLVLENGYKMDSKWMVHDKNEEEIHKIWI